MARNVVLQEITSFIIDQNCVKFINVIDAFSASFRTVNRRIPILQESFPYSWQISLELSGHLFFCR